MRHSILAVLVVPAFLAAAGSHAVRSAGTPGKQPHQSNSEWRQLFNGHDMDGWEHVGPGRFLVENGLLRTEGHMGLLWFTGEKFGNCELKVVYKVGKVDSNSGVFVRIGERPTDPWIGVHHGFEVQICDEEDDYHTTGVVYSLTKALARPEKTPGEWNTMLIKMKGTRVMVELNGVVVTDFDSTAPMRPRKQWYEPDRKPVRPEAGYIGLQNHDDKDSHVYFKEVSVRAL
ncbi:MAG TPA: DUF1080 domain-containing protein [Blastocatellia bacterium]|nr:DUF1080 domain-containing protein [Blastocatellia bacterium]